MKIIAKLWILAVFVCLNAFAATASAEETPSMLFEGGNSVLLFNVNEVTIEIQDQVNDQCMPRPTSVRRSAEATLRRNDFTIAKESEMFSNSVTINAIGYETSNSSCAVYFEAILGVVRAVTVPASNNLDSSLSTTLAPINYHFFGTLLTGTKSEMQTRIERQAERAMDDLFIKLDKARDRTKNKWPEVWNSVYE